MKMNDMSMEGEDVDCDIISKNTLNEVFSNFYHKDASISVGMNNSYPLHIDLKEGSQLAVGLSNNSVALYDRETMKKDRSFNAHSDVITGLKFSPSDSSNLYTGSLDQSIKLWDLRTNTGKPVSTFTDTSEKLSFNRRVQGKPLLAFDVNCTGQFLAAGTEQVQNDSFLLFWDVRTTKLVGGYWQSFSDDIRAVKFHPENPDWLATGGPDSIVNIFDIGCSTEDDALTTSSTLDGSGVSNMTWCSKKGKLNYLAIVSEDHQFSFWNIDETGPECHRTREDISLGIRRKNVEWTYIVNCLFDIDTENLYLMAGSSYPENPCLRLLMLKKTKLKPFSDLSNKSVSNTIVRGSVFDHVNKVFYVGSEEGYLSTWKIGQGDRD